MLHISLTRQELYRHIIIKILTCALNRQFYNMIVIYLGKKDLLKSKKASNYYILSFLDTILSKNLHLQFRHRWKPSVLTLQPKDKHKLSCLR